MTNHAAVRAASEAFYAALNSVFNKDAQPMRDALLHGAEVTAMRPNSGRYAGRDALWTAWQHVADVFEGGHVEMTERVIVECGDAAYETGLEIGTFHPRWQNGGGRAPGDAHLSPWPARIENRAPPHGQTRRRHGGVQEPRHLGPSACDCRKLPCSCKTQPRSARFGLVSPPAMTRSADHSRRPSERR